MSNSHTETNIFFPITQLIFVGLNCNWLFNIQWNYILGIYRVWLTLVNFYIKISLGP